MKMARDKNTKKHDQTRVMTHTDDEMVPLIALAMSKDILAELMHDNTSCECILPLKPDVTSKYTSFDSFC